MFNDIFERVLGFFEGCSNGLEMHRYLSESKTPQELEERMRQWDRRQTQGSWPFNA